MLNTILIKTFVAGAAINPNSLVKFGSDDNTVVPAAAATDAIIGVVNNVGAASGDRVDVIMIGAAEVEYGGNVTRGDLLTSDANGNAITAAPVAGANARLVGVAMVSGVSGDIGSVMVKPGSMQG